MHRPTSIEQAWFRTGLLYLSKRALYSVKMVRISLGDSGRLPVNTRNPIVAKGLTRIECSYIHTPSSNPAWLAYNWRIRKRYVRALYLSDWQNVISPSCSMPRPMFAYSASIFPFPSLPVAPM